MNGTTATAINTVYKMVDAAAHARDLGIETQVFCRLINRVEADLNEALRLRDKPGVQAHFQTDTAHEQYIEGMIYSVNEALASIGTFLLTTEKSVPAEPRHRLEYMLRNQTKLVTRQFELDTCHKSLLQGISSLAMIARDVVLDDEGSVYEDYLSPYKKRQSKRRARRRSVDTQRSTYSTFMRDVPGPVYPKDSIEAQAHEIPCPITANHTGTTDATRSDCFELPTDYNLSREQLPADWGLENFAELPASVPNFIIPTPYAPAGVDAPVGATENQVERPPTRGDAAVGAAEDQGEHSPTGINAPEVVPTDQEQCLPEHVQEECLPQVARDDAGLEAVKPTSRTKEWRKRWRLKMDLAAGIL
ncbi:hypothetical protein EJ06DRAFT_580271 [Trichodelitschia bisporula]|uniref:Uncharacterized protein n=1 Tax=Trichodelitschia bisporula TaxID=703511 RepID=A0A6G1I4I5_9PEZI|nr:hypothetical protein EJ06DRAFT_580271 [Trichodelitschia bisporula]